jgi:hypothetical protein
MSLGLLRPLETEQPSLVLVQTMRQPRKDPSLSQSTRRRLSMRASRGDDRRQEPFEALPCLGLLGRDSRPFGMNFSADMVRHQVDDPLAVGA